MPLRSDPTAEGVEAEEELFDALDEALTETFPASDPIAISSPDERDRTSQVRASKPPV